MLPIPCRCEDAGYFIFTAAGAVLVSPYTCAAIVTKPGNLIKLFVNELVAPTCGSGDRQERAISIHIARMQHTVLQPPTKLLKFTLNLLPK